MLMNMRPMMWFAVPAALAAPGAGAPPRPARSAPGQPATDRLGEQDDVEADDHGHYQAGRDRGHAAVDEVAHQLTVGTEEQQRHQCERDPEAEHHLADDQRLSRVDAEPE